MTRFLRLNRYLLNPKFISKIIIEPNQYIITMCEQQAEVGVFMGAGWGSTLTTEIKVDKNKLPDDYEKISTWIDDVTK